MGKNVPSSEDSSIKREMKRTTFFGDDELFLKTILSTVYGKKFENDDELYSRTSVIKNHIDNGCQLLDNIFKASNQDELKFFENLYHEIHDERIEVEEFPLL